MDLVVTLPKDQEGHLEEKIESVQGNSDFFSVFDWGYSWFDTKLRPKHFNEEDKVFIICNGIIKGYFSIYDILFEGSYENAYAILKHTLDMLRKVGTPYDPYMRIVFSDFTPIKPIKMKGFRGFRYRKFKYEVIEIEEEN